MVDWIANAAVCAFLALWFAIVAALGVAAVRDASFWKGVGCLALGFLWISCVHYVFVDDEKSEVE